MKEKHTKGPWKKQTYRIYANAFAKPEYPIHAPKRGLIAKAFRESDAILMAAAPELLEALKYMLSWGHCPAADDKARTAIAKVEGK